MSNLPFPTGNRAEKFVDRKFQNDRTALFVGLVNLVIGVCIAAFPGRIKNLSTQFTFLREARPDQAAAVRPPDQPSFQSGRKGSFQKWSHVRWRLLIFFNESDLPVLCR